MAIVSFNNIGTLGLIKDVQPEQLPADQHGIAWTNALNIRFQNGSAKTVPGAAVTIDTSSTVAPYFYTRIPFNGNSYYVYGGLNKFYCYYSGTHYNITRQTAGTDVDYSCTNDYLWHYCVLNGFPVFNNGVDTPQAWTTVNQSTRLSNLTAWPTSYKAGIIRSFKAYLVAADITNATPVRYQNKILWSGAALPGALPSTWDITDATNDAGEIELSDSEGYVVDMLQLGDNNIIYKNTSTYVMQYVGGDKIFSFKKVFPNVGMLTHNCAVAIEGKHFVVTNDDVIVHDGFQYESVIDARNRKYLFHTMTTSAAARTFCVANRAASEIWVCYATGGSTFPNTAMVWNYVNNTWSTRTLPGSGIPSANCGFIDFATGSLINSYSSTIFNSATFTYNQTSYPTTTWVVSAVDHTNSKIYWMDASTDTLNGTLQTCTLERVNIPLGDDQSIKTVRRMWLKANTAIASGAAINVYVGTQMSKNAAVEWQGPYSFDINNANTIDFFATGRYISLRFTTTADTNWGLENFDIDVTKRGNW